MDYNLSQSMNYQKFNLISHQFYDKFHEADIPPTVDLMLINYNDVYDRVFA